MRHEQALRISLSEAPLIASFLLNKGKAPSFEHIGVLLMASDKFQLSAINHQSNISTTG
jgi:hypothetical protein